MMMMSVYNVVCVYSELNYLGEMFVSIRIAFLYVVACKKGRGSSINKEGDCLLFLSASVGVSSFMKAIGCGGILL